MKHVGWPFAVVVALILVGLIYFNETGAGGLVRAEPVLASIYVDFRDPEHALRATKNHSLVSFWTPSDDTVAKLKQLLAAGAVIPEQDRWQMSVTDAALERFSTALGSTVGVTGYRRFADVGEGRSFPKPGFWWQVTADGSFKLENLLQLYRAMCNCGHVYIEIVAVNDSKYEDLVKGTE